MSLTQYDMYKDFSFERVDLVCTRTVHYHTADFGQKHCKKNRRSRQNTATSNKLQQAIDNTATETSHRKPLIVFLCVVIISLPYLSLRNPNQSSFTVSTMALSSSDSTPPQGRNPASQKRKHEEIVGEDDDAEISPETATSSNSVPRETLYIVVRRVGKGENESLYLELDSQASVLDLKTKIAATLQAEEQEDDIPVERQRLIFAGKMLRDDNQSLQKDLNMKPNNNRVNEEEDEEQEVLKHFIHLSPLPRGAAPSVRTERELADVRNAAAATPGLGNDLMSRHEENMRRARRIGARQRRRRREGQMAADAAAIHPSAMAMNNAEILGMDGSRDGIATALNAMAASARFDRLSRGQPIMAAEEAASANAGAQLTALLAGDSLGRRAANPQATSSEDVIALAVANGAAQAASANRTADHDAWLHSAPVEEYDQWTRQALSQRFHESAVRDAFFRQRHPEYDQQREMMNQAALAGPDGYAVEAALSSSMAAMNAAADAAVAANPYHPCENTQATANALGVSPAALTQAIAVSQYNQSQQQTTEAALLSALGGATGLGLSAASSSSAANTAAAASALLHDILMALPGGISAANVSLPDVLDQVAANAGGLAASLRLLHPHQQQMVLATTPLATTSLTSPSSSPPAAAQMLHEHLANAIASRSALTGATIPGFQQTLFPF